MICQPDSAFVNNGNELITSCRHENRLPLKNFNACLVTQLRLYLLLTLASIVWCNKFVHNNYRVSNRRLCISYECNIWQFYPMSAAQAV